MTIINRQMQFRKILIIILLLWVLLENYFDDGLDRAYSKRYFQLFVLKKLDIHHEGHEEHEERQREL